MSDGVMKRELKMNDFSKSLIKKKERKKKNLEIKLYNSQQYLLRSK
jgi:hypothetical protein